jgi:hypothetical protein
MNTKEIETLVETILKKKSTDEYEIAKLDMEIESVDVMHERLSAVMKNYFTMENEQEMAILTVTLEWLETARKAYSGMLRNKREWYAPLETHDEKNYLADPAHLQEELVTEHVEENIPEHEFQWLKSLLVTICTVGTFELLRFAALK